LGAITTARELAFGIALDQPPAGWKLVRPAPIKSLTMALLSGEPVTLSLADPWLEPLLEQKNVRLAPRTLHKDPLVVSSGGTHLIYRRQDLVVGIGCSRNCPAEDLIGLVGSTLADAGIATESITGLYTALVKADEDAVAALARALDLPVRYYSIDTLNTVRHRLKNPSPDVQAAIGTPGVAEAAALLAAGPDGELIVEKRKSGNATCAIARQGAAPGNPGRLRGLLNIIGIGPGHAAGRTVEATNAILTADHVVGYGGYLDLVKPLLGHQEVRAFPLGEEIDRCRYAIETAAAGTSVALICSGDSGIYAMAAPVFEILDQDGDSLPAAAHRIAIHCLPGVSAMQTASARAGAVLGHDFAVVSLSDLMTPAEKILERLQAAAEGDFVIALYNPASHERKKLIYQALEIVRQYRSPTTPVLIARNVGRIGESSTVATLATVPVSSADMVTTLIIGNSQSRSFEMGPGTRVVYTPRGYTDPGRGARAAGGNPS
ncbi:MAG: precorrin-3B C(17)-methyltransferase, partial [Rhodobacteraceae bacterium]|nr:precorrin-3B C(17)-methyltransferase [Paracoccaceae bacterium]